ncbi:MAG: DUF427 domain-containing protein, partial [Actinomycetota bacterium]|nr:DUF427 domain-containing protein [Actinomycetota bacterium]
VIYWEPSLPRMRAMVGAETVIDSRRVHLLHETGLLPVHYFPRDDVRFDLLEATEHRTHCPFKGDASYWSIRAGDVVVENAVWGYPRPIEGAPPLADHVAVYFDHFDAWYEEDEPVYARPRDPYHRVDVRSGSYEVVVRHRGQVIAESRRPKLLFETGLPVRWYLPPADVRTDLLRASDTVSECPYKGDGQHWHLADGGGDEVEDAAWSLPHPLPEALAAARHLCFYSDKVDVEVDGRRVEA